MIDTKELRRLAQEAMHPVTKGRWMRLFGERTVYDRMEDGCRGIPVVSTPVNPPHPFEAACLDFIAAANPAVISELLDRLEAAEADALEQARLNGMGSEREAALMAKLEAAEKSDAESIAMYRKALDERDALHAKIEAMEKQEPVAWLHETRRDSDVVTDAVKHVWGKVAVGSLAAYSIPLYLAPGAQPAPSVPDGFSREDLEAVADGLDGYEKTVNVGNVTGEGDDHLESTTAYAARFIRTMLAATPETKP